MNSVILVIFAHFVIHVYSLGMTLNKGVCDVESRQRHFKLSFVVVKELL
jgi:hypothetical protein